MSQPDGKSADDRLDAYLDDQMTPSQRSAFERELSDRDDLRELIALQAKIDASLARQFPAAMPTQEPDFHAQAARTEKGSAASRPSTTVTRRLVAAVAVAAALGWALFTFTNGDRGMPGPVFSPQPLAQIYRQTVANGFEPYYECRDDQRFRDTFARRQGQPLTLASLPAGSAMMGLSYPGGLSRDTTAILCRVDGQPVMVFVDRATNDQSTATQNNDEGIGVFRQQRDGLVFYEVTPLPTERLIDYLQSPADLASNQE